MTKVTFAVNVLNLFCSIMTFLKLFVAMGLTWMVEVATFFMSTETSNAPEALVITLNVLNIFQVKQR